MDEISAIVLSVSIDFNNHITYRCSWFSGKERKSEWFEECEISFRELDTIRIGFAHA